MPWVDPYNHSTLKDEFIVVSLVNLKASGHQGWLEQGLKVPSKWWIKNAGRLPILQEVVELIRKHKPMKGGRPACRATRTA